MRLDSICHWVTSSILCVHIQVHIQVHETRARDMQELDRSVLASWSLGNLNYSLCFCDGWDVLVVVALAVV